MSLRERLSGAIGRHDAGLELARGPKRWRLGRRPLALGRSPESDVVIPGDSVSRLHAWLIPAPNGVLLVDQSRLGTLVNGARIEAPALLGPGDVITIAECRYEVCRVEPRPAPPAPGAAIRKVREWVRRYGPSEVLGTVAAVGAAVTIHDLTGNLVVAAYAGACAENLVFYGIMFLRESVRAAHDAGGRGRHFGTADLVPVARNLLLEFGVAELIDTGLVRPLLMGLGLKLIGGSLGGVVGKLAADLVFYGPVLAVYEWRLARGRARVRTDPRRRTTAVGLQPPPEP